MKNSLLSHYVFQKLEGLTENGVELITVLIVLGMVLKYYKVEQITSNSSFLLNYFDIVFLIGVFLIIVTGRLIYRTYVEKI